MTNSLENGAKPKRKGSSSSPINFQVRTVRVREGTISVVDPLSSRLGFLGI